MACGLPIVGIRSPGVADTVEDGKTGLLAAEDIGDYAAKITRLCADMGLRQAMGQASQEASSRYAIERTAAALLEQYERLVSVRRLIASDGTTRAGEERRA
jgi:glycosyltransferase involved in cell wall biosynthesis